jgi:Negative regulator of sigma F
VVTAGVLMFGVRPDAADAVRAMAWVAGAGLALVTAGVAGWLALAASQPGRLPGRAVAAIGGGVAALWVAFELGRLAAGGAPLEALRAEGVDVVCGVRVAAMAALPAALLIRLVERGAPLRRAPAWGLAALAALAAGAAGVQLVCPIDRPAHLLLWHLTPAFAASALTGLAALGRPGPGLAAPPDPGSGASR